MLIAVTILAVALSSLVLVQVEKRWKMSTYLWSMLGYGSGGNTSNDGKTDDPNGVIATEPQPRKETSTVRLQVQEPVIDEGDETPKAAAAPNTSLPPIPSFTLQEHDDGEGSSEEEDNLPPPSFPALNSAQRASVMPPPAAPPKIPTLKPLSNGSASSNGLMAPPPRPVPSLRAPAQASATAGLRIPASGPIPNRGPTNGNSLGVLNTTATKTPNPRQKVLLKPGHSPLDWANLKKSGRNLSGVDRLVRVTPSMLKAKNGRKGNPAWSSYQGKVYNISPYLPYHPGGEGELRRAAGKDGGKLFHDVHPWVNWENMLEGCMVGIMVSEGDGDKELTSSLDEMD